jgi:PBSX family phage portal protein
MSIENKNNNAVVPIEKSANVSHSQVNQKTMNKIRARIFPLDVSKNGEPGKPKNIPQDPFHTLAAAGDVIEPPFDMLTLAMLPEHSGEMTQCIDTMKVNIDGFGHRFVSRIKKRSDGEEPPDEIKIEVKKERVRLINFFQYCTKESFVEFRKKLRTDKETTGNAYFEVIRDDNGDIQSFVHLPSYQVRLGRLDEDYLLVDRKILELQFDDSVKVKTIKEWRRFRKFVQSKVVYNRSLSTIGGYKMAWFKEFGDPRDYDMETGLPVPPDHPNDRKANEIVHLSIYSSRTPYGLPRYIGNLLSIFGDRAAEEINYTTFKNNNIPSMAVMVSNGQLTEGTIDRITDFVESQIQGSDNYSKFLVLEAEGLMEGEESGSNVKIEIKPLTEQQHKDALFQEYSTKNQDRIRRVWRLPPIFVGKTDDYTRTTAEASRVLADEQVFAPERTSWDDFMNRILFPEMEVVYHFYKSNSPNTTDNQQLVKILGGAEKTGGMTPEIAREILEDILGKELPPLTEEFPSNVPFSLTMADAVKNQADVTEPGQQVTALKVVTSALDSIQKRLEGEFELQIEKNRTLLETSEIDMDTTVPNDV